MRGRLQGAAVVCSLLRGAMRAFLKFRAQFCDTITVHTRADFAGCLLARKTQEHNGNVFKQLQSFGQALQSTISLPPHEL